MYGSMVKKWPKLGEKSLVIRYMWGAHIPNSVYQVCLAFYFILLYSISSLIFLSVLCMCEHVCVCVCGWLVYAGMCGDQRLIAGCLP